MTPLTPESTSNEPATPYYWQGAWIDRDEADRRLDALVAAPPPSARRPRARDVVAACGRLAALLADPAGDAYARLHGELTDPLGAALPAPEACAQLGSVARALDPGHLDAQLVAELGGPDRDRPRDALGHRRITEEWRPVGTLVHVAPSNVATAGFLSAVEGLLTGNLNLVKTGGEDGLFTQLALALLADADPGGSIREHTVVLRFSSRDTKWLARLCRVADTVAVWGTEEAVAGVTRHAPPGCRIVEWGPKISLAYLDRTSRPTPELLGALARDTLRNAQRTSTSPQILYVDAPAGGPRTPGADLLFSTAAALAEALGRAAKEFPPVPRSTAEQAEITNVVTVAGLEEHLDLTRTLSAPDGRWHVLADTRGAPAASPLFGTLWVKPLPREHIVRALHPMRRYLQTVGLGCAPDATEEIADAFFRAGALRVTPIGDMLTPYPGEPHDGVLTLQRYSRRVSLVTAAEREGAGSRGAFP